MESLSPPLWFYLIPSCEHQLWTPSEDAEEDPHVRVWHLPGDVGVASRCVREFRHTVTVWRHQQPVVSQK